MQDKRTMYVEANIMQGIIRYASLIKQKSYEASELKSAQSRILFRASHEQAYMINRSR